MEVLLEVPITFEFGERIVHSPMVHATVSGVRTKFILDSGASDHVFTMDLARRAGLKTGEAEPGFDHVGAPVPSLMLGDVSVDFEGTTLVLAAVPAFEGPPAFAAEGVGGFLSPQSLHPIAWVVMDFARNQLVLVAGGAPEVVRWMEERWPAFEVMSLERVAAETLVVLGAIEPFAGVPTMLNTGSSGTEFAAAAVPGLRGTPSEGSGYGISGSSVDGEEARDQVLRLGGRAFAVPVVLIRDPMPPPPGQVGMDVLAGTVLAVGALPTQPVLWLVP